MATKSVTRATGFNFSPAHKMHLFSLNSGFDLALAVCEASALEAGVRALLHEGIANNGDMDGDVLNLCLFALEAASTIRASADVHF